MYLSYAGLCEFFPTTVVDELLLYKVRAFSTSKVSFLPLDLLSALKPRM